MCCSDFFVAAVCDNCNSETGEVRMLSLYYGWNWHGYYAFAVYALHCCLCAGLTVALHTHYLFHSTVVAMSALRTHYLFHSAVVAMSYCYCCSDPTRMRGRAAIPHSHLPAGLLALMRRVVNYHSSWVGQQQVELLLYLVFQVISQAVALTQLVVPQEVDRVSRFISQAVALTQLVVPPKCLRRCRLDVEVEEEGSFRNRKVRMRIGVVFLFVVVVGERRTKLMT
ncbi:hypothetical protein F511_40897 [Dorcoceras hygrometricum]|uniref:Uncharacterized protein n=1 Tax=Dorcoceras hygrometricum TaxID=472368 RepID=A0A2Z7CFK7_9LAMI|nr:hypothetical protein F511_40897 [Dorcoceras hygrometricum]